MDDLVFSYISKVLEYEEKGFAQEAIQLLDKVLSAFPNERTTLLLEGAKLKYRNGYDKEALLNFIDYYNLFNDPDVYELVIEAYYQKNAEKYLEAYKRNNSLLDKYPYIYIETKRAELPEVLPVWVAEEFVVWAEPTSRSFHFCNKMSIIESECTIVAVINEIWEENLKKYMSLKKASDGVVPIYFIYDREYWEFMLQIIDIEQFLKLDGVAFFIGEEAVMNYFSQDMTLLPEEVVEPSVGKYSALIRRMLQGRKKETKKAEEKIALYYDRHGIELLKEIKAKEVRILFITSRFTTVLQYHTKACLEAAHRLGYSAKMMIEKDDLCGITNWDLMRQIANYKPQIVWVLDYFRFQDIFIQKEIVWVTWIQDILPHIIDKHTPEKLFSRDIVISHFTTWRRFKEIGYQDVIDAPVPADPNVYRLYQLTDGEFSKYQCDICFVCHASDVNEHINWISDKLPSEWRERISLLYNGYKDFVYQTNVFFYNLNQFILFVDGVLKKNFAINVDKKFLYSIADDMYKRFNQRVYRQCLVDWLLDAGYTNLKLWGNGWTKEPKYAKYAMGPAENGEVLSKIYQASKIVLGNNIMTTAAARAWESMLSGAFYLSNYIPPEDDITDIRKIVKENEELIMFYDKEDLLRKVDYYLNHEEERRRMAEIGRKAAFERMTFDKLMEKVIEEIPKIIEKREKKEMQEQNG